MNPIYKTLGKVVEVSEQTNKFGEYPIQYTQPNYQDTAKVWNHSAPEAKLPETAIEKLVTLKPGDLFCAHVQKDENGFPKIVDITDAKDAEKKDANGQTFFKKGGAGNSRPFTPKDETGIAVGAAWTNAIEYSKLTQDDSDGLNLDVLDKLAWDILQRKLKHEAKLRASKAATATTSEIKAEEAKPLSRAEQLKAKKAASTRTAPVEKVDTTTGEVTEDLIDSDLDGVSFD